MKILEVVEVLEIAEVRKIVEVVEVLKVPEIAEVAEITEIVPSQLVRIILVPGHTAVILRLIELFENRMRSCEAGCQIERLGRPVDCLFCRDRPGKEQRREQAEAAIKQGISPYPASHDTGHGNTRNRFSVGTSRQLAPRDEEASPLFVTTEGADLTGN